MIFILIFFFYIRIRCSLRYKYIYSSCTAVPCFNRQHVYLLYYIVALWQVQIIGVVIVIAVIVLETESICEID